MDSKEISIGKVKIGNGNPIAIQSMTNTPTTDIEATVKQITQLATAGCEIVRVAIPDQAAAKSFAQIVQQTTIPVVADIHFDYRLAIAAIEAGAAKIRINPGNIGDQRRVQAVIDAAKAADIPIRIGLNKGSYSGDLITKALEYIEFFEKNNFFKIVLSIKSSSVQQTIKLNRLLAQKTNYPIHIGITEAGTISSGIVKSAIGIGTLLSDNIGDTIRVSLTADPLQEVLAAKKILASLDLITAPEVIACPTCGRTKINLIALAEQVEQFMLENNILLKVAVMGCVVNGPGEAKDADYGIAGGNQEGLIFSKGKIIKKVAEDQLLTEFFKILKQA